MKYDEGFITPQEVDLTMWSKKTQMVVDDLEIPHDYERAKWLKCIEDIKAEIERVYKEEEPIDHTWAVGLKHSLKIIDRHVNELRGETE